VWTALLSKELRESGLFAGLALLAQMQLLGSGMDMSLIPFLSSGRGAEIPFLAARSFSLMSDRELMFITIAIISAIVIGLNQTLMESWRQTSLFLLHRPVPRSQIFLVKLAAGGLILLGTSALPLLIYCLWAAKPGTHASPFFWSMTEPWWRSVVIWGLF
jgi:ABC-type transport system involved in multi-copper enzyme maturation permease subunit